MNYIHFEKTNISLVDMKKEKDKIFSQLSKKWIEKFLWKKPIIILASKKWYSSSIICQDCGYSPMCKNCDVPVSYHQWWKNSFFWLCHICKTNYDYILSCPKCWWNNLQMYWVWVQKISEILTNFFSLKNEQIQIIDSAHTKSKNKLFDINLENKQIILWTSLLSIKPKNIDPWLVIVVNADIWLNSPDFNAQRRNYSFLLDTYRHYNPTPIIIQSFSPESYSIQSICKWDQNIFLDIDRQYRQSFWYPPFEQICVIKYKNEIEEKAYNVVHWIYKDILYFKQQTGFDWQIYATPASIFKVYWKFNYQIVIKSKQCREFCELIFEKLKLSSKGFKIDREPESLL